MERALGPSLLADGFLLAEASMAEATPRVTTSTPILSSPRLAIEAAVRVANARAAE